MTTCIPQATCTSTATPRLYDATTHSLKTTLLSLGLILGLDQTYSDSVNTLFNSWTTTNFISQVNTLLTFLSILKTPFGTIIPGFDSVFDTLILGFGGFLQITTNPQFPLTDGTISTTLTFLEKFWNIFVADIEDGVDYVRTLGPIDPFFEQIISGFPQYPAPIASTSCHSTYNDLIGDSGNVLRPATQNDVSNILKNKNNRNKKSDR